MMVEDKGAEFNPATGRVYSTIETRQLKEVTSVSNDPDPYVLECLTCDSTGLCGVCSEVEI